jgi:hypothetical protein
MFDLEMFLEDATVLKTLKKEFIDADIERFVTASRGKSPVVTKESFYRKKVVKPSKKQEKTHLEETILPGTGNLLLEMYTMTKEMFVRRGA